MKHFSQVFVSVLCKVCVCALNHHAKCCSHFGSQHQKFESTRVDQRHCLIKHKHTHTQITLSYTTATTLTLVH